MTNYDPNSEFSHSSVGTHPAIDPTPYPGTSPETSPFPPSENPLPGDVESPADAPLPEEADPQLPRPAADKMIELMGFDVGSAEEQYTNLQQYSFRTIWR